MSELTSQDTPFIASISFFFCNVYPVTVQLPSVAAQLLSNSLCLPFGSAVKHTVVPFNIAHNSFDPLLVFCCIQYYAPDGNVLPPLVCVGVM